MNIKYTFLQIELTFTFINIQKHTIQCDVIEFLNINMIVHSSGDEGLQMAIRHEIEIINSDAKSTNCMLQRITSNLST